MKESEDAQSKCEYTVTKIACRYVNNKCVNLDVWEWQGEQRSVCEWHITHRTCIPSTVNTSILVPAVCAYGRENL